MKIEFLYFDGCPNHEIALSNLQTVLDKAGIKDKIEVINIVNSDDVTRHRFLGSPSIRIDGIDLEISEDEATAYSMRCRLYKNGPAMQGYPPEYLIRILLDKTREA